ncbi:MAG: hypothetical protein ACYST6_21295, partial [Planctomycetota bacterium]
MAIRDAPSMAPWFSGKYTSNPRALSSSAGPTLVHQAIFLPEASGPINSMKYWPITPFIFLPASKPFTSTDDGIVKLLLRFVKTHKAGNARQTRRQAIRAG